MQTLADYIDRYGTLLGQQATQRLRPLHVPSRDQALDLSHLRRKPLPGQAHAITACRAVLKRQKSVILNGEMGVGKTLVGIAVAHAHAQGKPYNALVFCPPHLVKKWEREIRDTLNDVDVVQVPSFHLLAKLNSIRSKLPKRPVWWIISETTAKLGTGWEPVYVMRRKAYGRGRSHVHVGECVPGRARYSDPTPHCAACGCEVMEYDAKSKSHVPMEPSELAKHQTTCLECGEALWQHNNKFKRWPVASYIHKQMRGWLDYLILDEAHQTKSDESAIGNASAVLASAAKKIIILTGTLIGGYAEHLRPMLFRCAPTTLVEEGYTWDDETRFNETYGRIEIKTITRESKTASRYRSLNKNSKGAKSTKRKSLRPGVMPQFVGRHLLDKTVFLSLEELSADLPELYETVMPVEMDDETEAEYKRIEDALRKAAQQASAQKNRTLLGSMLSALLGWVDHPYEWGDIGYWGIDEQGAKTWNFIITPKSLSPKTIRPKEQELIDLIKAEKAEGRQCWVFTTMTGKRDVTERLRKLLVAEGIRTTILRSEVDPCDREEWIAKHGKDHDVIISHPQLVETGMDLFDKGGSHNFVTLIHYMTGYNLFTLRQVSRRHWRIGQKRECRVYYLFYAETMQNRAMTLMGRKLTAAQAIEGRFSIEGLAAMADDNTTMEAALTQSLVNALDDFNTAREWEKIGQAKPVTPMAPMLAPPEKPREATVPIVVEESVAQPKRHVIVALPIQRGRKKRGPLPGQLALGFNNE